MVRRLILASAATALTLAPLAAQAAPARVSADVEQAEGLYGTTAWILGAIGLGLAIWGIVELTSDDEPASP